jgi:hypothetical protein
MRTSSRAGTARTPAQEELPRSAPIGLVELAGMISGEETVTADAILGKILLRVAARPLFLDCMTEAIR